MAALNQPPDPLHGLPLPEVLSDETLAVRIENHYCGQLQRDHAPHDYPPHDPVPDPDAIPDPPFRSRPPATTTPPMLAAQCDRSVRVDCEIN